MIKDRCVIGGLCLFLRQRRAGRVCHTDQILRRQDELHADIPAADNDLIEQDAGLVDDRSANSRPGYSPSRF